jgi:ribosomal protein S30
VLEAFCFACCSVSQRKKAVKPYDSLFALYGAQKPDTIFAHFYPKRRAPADPADYDEPFKEMARMSLDGYDAWIFQQPKFRAKHASSAVPKLKNYLNYTFVRLVTPSVNTQKRPYMNT